MKFTVDMILFYHLDIEYSDWEMNGEFEVEPLRLLDETPFTIIATEDGIRSLVTQLRQCRMISVSVIQHRYRSYLGYSSIIMVGFDFCRADSRFLLQLLITQSMRLSVMTAVGFSMSYLQIRQF